MIILFRSVDVAELPNRSAAGWIGVTVADDIYTHVVLRKEERQENAVDRHFVYGE